MFSIRQSALMVLAVLVSAATVLAAELPKALVDPYLTVQAALAGDSTAGVADAARAIEMAAASLGADGAPVVAGAKKLNGAKTLADARGAFGELSVAIVDYATKTKADIPAGLHVAYCPMADRPWLQTEKDIKNPYYGSSMLTCGTFKK
jgi:hypothetical protein